MMEITVAIVGAAAGLVWFGGRYHGSPSWPRFLAISLASLLALTVLGLVFEPTSSLAMALLPAGTGLLAIATVAWIQAGRPWPLSPTQTGLLGVGLVVIGVSVWRVSQGPIALLMLALGPVCGLAWSAPTGPRRALAWPALAAVWLAGPLLWLLTPEASLSREPDAPTLAYSLVIYLVWPGLTTALAGRLVFAALTPEGGSGWIRRGLSLASAAALIATIGGLVIYQTTWDLATDGLNALGLVSMAVLPAAVAAGMLMGWSLPGGRRLGGLAFAAVVPLALFQVISDGLLTTRPLDLTQARAAAMAQAIERFHAEQGHYPATLAELPAWFHTRLFEPVIWRDETWCYEGGADFYRLGYVHRPAFGVPAEYISLKLTASAGAPPAARWVCDERLALQQARAPVLP